MKRRGLVSLAASVIPLVALAQQRVARLAFVTSSGNVERPAHRAFQQRLWELGWAEGRTVATIFCNPDSATADAVAEAVRTAVASQPDVIVADGRVSSVAVAAATGSIPIIAMLGGDPVEYGLADSLARPGRNMTGITQLAITLNEKRLEMLLEAVPRARGIGILSSRENGGIDTAAATLASRGVGVRRLIIATAPEIEAQLTLAGLADVDAVHVLSDILLDSWPARVVAQINAARKPAVYPGREYAAAGGLLSYGPDMVVLFRRLAEYVDRVLRGANPAEMAFERPSRFEMVLNLKTAAEIGLDVPATILARADEVIE
jgi:putative ABC transport system substrate-binding protein